MYSQTKCYSMCYDTQTYRLTSGYELFIYPKPTIHILIAVFTTQQHWSLT